MRSYGLLRARGVPMFLGLTVDSVQDACFGSPSSRRRIRLAHEMHNRQRDPELLARQRAHCQQRSDERFHIRCFVRGKTAGFQAMRASPRDLIISEWNVCASQANVQAAPPTHHNENPNTLLQCSRQSKIEDTVEKILTAMCRQSSDAIAAACSVQSSARIVSGRSSALFRLLGVQHDYTRARYVSELAALLNGSLLRLICRKGDTTWSCLHEVLFSEGRLAHCQVEDDHREGVVIHICLLQCDPRFGVVASALSRDSCVALWDAVGELKVHRSLSMFAAETQANAIAQPRLLSSGGLTLPWVAETTSASRARSTKRLHSKQVDRTPFSKSKAHRAVTALNNILNGPSSICGDPSELHVNLNANRHSLTVAFRLATHQRKANSFLVVAGENRQDLATVASVPKHHVRVAVVEFTLEKLGMPHEFVVQDILAELHSSHDENWLGKLPPTVAAVAETTVLTHCGVIDGSSHSFQRCRIRGPVCIIPALRDLQARLRDGRWRTVEGSHQNAQSSHSTNEERALQDVWDATYYRIHDVSVLWEETAESASTDKAFAEVVKRLHRAISRRFDLQTGKMRYNYELVLRKIPADLAENARLAVMSLGCHGFLNYFAPQRFSASSAKGMHPGLHLLKGEYQAAAYLLLGSRTYGSDDTGGNTTDSTIQQVLRQALSAEQSEHHGDQKSLVVTPATNEVCRDAFHFVLGVAVIRSLVQEFLVFVWNEVLSQRVATCGLEVLEGDLVMKAEDSLLLEGSNTEIVESPRQAGSHCDTRQQHIGFVTKRDIDAKVFEISDVLLPIPGAGVLLPNNKTKDMYRSTLKGYGVLYDIENECWPLFGSAAPTSLGEGEVENTQLEVVEDDDMLPIGRTINEIATTAKEQLGMSYRGGYRPMVFVPQLTLASVSFDSQWDAQQHSPDHHRTKPSTRPYWQPKGGTGVVKLNFELPLGVYPSMLVRELTKLDVAFHPSQSGVSEDASASHKKVGLLEKRRLLTISTMKSHDRGIYQNVLNKKRRSNIALAPMALQRASLHQRIFRSNGMRRSLLPSTKGRDDVAK